MTPRQDSEVERAVASAVAPDVHPSETSTEEDAAEKLVVEFARGAITGIGLLAFAAAFFILGAAWRGSQIVGG